jgi:hypothetical protein
MYVGVQLAATVCSMRRRKFSADFNAVREIARTPVDRAVSAP